MDGGQHGVDNAAFQGDTPATRPTPSVAPSSSQPAPVNQSCLPPVSVSAPVTTPPVSDVLSEVPKSLPIQISPEVIPSIASTPSPVSALDSLSEPAVSTISIVGSEPDLNLDISTISDEPINMEESLSSSHPIDAATEPTASVGPEPSVSPLDQAPSDSFITPNPETNVPLPIDSSIDPVTPESPINPSDASIAPPQINIEGETPP